MSSRTKLIIGGVAGVIIIGVIVAIVLSLPHSTPKYTFYQGLDSNGGDITCQTSLANNVSALEAACNADATCLGFNTNGCLKNVLQPQSSWYSWTSDPSKGFYLKQKS